MRLPETLPEEKKINQSINQSIGSRRKGKIEKRKQVSDKSKILFKVTLTGGVDP